MAAFDHSLKSMSQEGLKDLLDIAENGPDSDSGFAVSCLAMSPFNALTCEPYTGRNGSRLWLEALKVRKEVFFAGKHDIDPRYMTFAQVQEYADNHNVRCGLKKGARGVSIIVPGEISLRLSPREVSDAEAAFSRNQPATLLRPHNAGSSRFTLSSKLVAGRKKVRTGTGEEIWKVLSGFQSVRVFACRDMYGILPLEAGQKDFSITPSLKKLFAGIDATLVSSSSVNETVYNPSQRIALVPSASRFAEKGDFDRSALHEWYHASAPVLSRESLTPARQAEEEAEAEMFSLLVGDALGLPGDARRADSARYIKDWSVLAARGKGQCVWDCLAHVRSAAELAEKILSTDQAEEPENSPAP